MMEDLSKYPIKRLRIMLSEAERTLDELRRKEPSAKRKYRTKHEHWASLCQRYIQEICDLRDAIISKKKSEAEDAPILATIEKTFRISSLNQYAFLLLDRELPKTYYQFVLVNGTAYRPEYFHIRYTEEYRAHPNIVVIKSDMEFSNTTIEFI